MSLNDPTNSLEQYCESFTSDWASGDRPSIVEYSERVDEHLRIGLIERLIPIDIEHRQRLGEPVADEDYRALGEFAIRVAGDCLEGVGFGAEPTMAFSPAIDSSSFDVDQLEASDPTTLPRQTHAGHVVKGGDSPNHPFGDYELIEELARGGMGVVYKARHKKLKRTVALKMILAGRLASDQEIQRFYAEAESAASLEHPGIVPIHEVGQVGEQHYFTMAFIDGQSLADVVRAGPLTPDRAADYVGQIANAISYAHSKNVIHRDLKPANVLLDDSGHVKVTDFGLAKQTQLDDQLTATGQIMGTPSYMPPEQASGKHSLVDETSDVYSIGALFYCLLTGRPPFQAATPMETLVQVIEQDPVVPRALVPGIPRDLETICLKCLQKEKHRRYQTAAELAAEIQRFENGQPISARPVSRLERTARWMQHRSQPLWVATLTGLAVAFLLVIGLIGRFAYQQSLLGYVDLRTNEEEGYLVATIFDEQNQEVERQTLPTQEAIALPEGSYQVRLSGARRMSKDVQLEVERGSRGQPYSPEMSLKDSELWPTIEHEGSVEFLDFGNRADAILMDDQGISRVSGLSGRTIWKTDIANAAKSGGAAASFRWWRNFGNTLNEQRSLKTRPKLLQSLTDLDGDGTRDLVVSGSEQAWLMALSGKNGMPLWIRFLNSIELQRVDFGAAVLRSAVVHPPLATADMDRDGVAEILTIVFDMGPDRNSPPRRWLELSSGKTGEQIWTAELDGSWFDEKNVPMDLAWLHTGMASGGSSSSSASGGLGYSRSRLSTVESGPKFYLTSPLLFATRDGNQELYLLAGNRLVHVQLDSGKTDEVALGFAPLKTPEIADLDNDGNDEILFLVETGLTTRPTELIVWSTATNDVAWRKKLASTWGAVRKLGHEIANWPCVVDLNGDGQMEVITPDFTTHDAAMWSYQKPYGGLSAFDAAGNLIWKQQLISLREQLDRFIAGPDIDEDGWRDIFVVTDDARSNQVVWNEKAILVDAISGRNGERIWWNHQVLHASDQGYQYGETLRWWNAGNDGWPQLLVGVESDLFAFSPRTGGLAGFGHFIDSILVADGDGDDLDDLFFLRKGNLGSYRGRPQINWMRPPMRITRSADVNADGIDDVAYRNKLISGSNGKTIWETEMELGPAFSQAPNETMFVLDHDLNNDGFKDVLANCDHERGRRRFAKLISGRTGGVLWNAQGDLSGHPIWHSELSHVATQAMTTGDVELTAIVTESREVFTDSYFSSEPGHTWLVRLNGRSGKTKWKVPIFEKEISQRQFDVIHKDLNNDGISDVLTAGNAAEDSTGEIVAGKLQLRAYDGRDGTLIWTAPVVQLDENQLDSFPRLTVVDTAGGAVVTFYDHRNATAGLRVINGATGEDVRFPMNWTQRMPETSTNRIQLPWPEVIQDRNSGEHFFAFSAWTIAPGVTTDWNGKEIEPKGVVEEITILNADGDVVSRFVLPKVSGNRFPANRQRIWSHDTDQDGVDELILLDQNGLTAIDPFNRKLVWSWKPRLTNNLRLDSIRHESDGRTVGVVHSLRKVFGIDLSTGSEIWIASDKAFPRNQWSREEIQLLDCQGSNPRVLFMNDIETVCVTTRSELPSHRGDLLPVPASRLAKNDPRSFRFLPWVEQIPFVRSPDPVSTALEEIVGLLVCVPMLFLFFVIPWFWLKQVIRRRRFSIRSLLLLIAFVGLGTLFFSRRSQIPEPFRFSYENLAIGLGVVLPPLVFAYSLIRMLLLGERKSLKWVLAGMLVLAVVFAAAALIAVNDFASDEVYSYQYGWTLVLWLCYIMGVLLIAFEFVKYCVWIPLRTFISKMRRRHRPLATV